MKFMIRTERALPPLLPPFPSSSFALQRGGTKFFGLSLFLSLSPLLSLVRNLGSLHATIVTSSSSTSINSSFSPSLLPRSKREKSRCLSYALYPCRARVSGDQRGRSSELFTLSRGIISVKMWTVSRRKNDPFTGEISVFVIEGEGERRGYPHKDEILRCLSNLFSRICDE